MKFLTTILLLGLGAAQAADRGIARRLDQRASDSHEVHSSENTGESSEYETETSSSDSIEELPEICRCGMKAVCDILCPKKNCSLRILAEAAENDCSENYDSKGCNLGQAGFREALEKGLRGCGQCQEGHMRNVECSPYCDAATVIKRIQPSINIDGRIHVDRNAITGQCASVILATVTDGSGHPSKNHGRRGDPTSRSSCQCGGEWIDVTYQVQFHDGKTDTRKLRELWPISDSMMKLFGTVFPPLPQIPSSTFCVGDTVQGKYLGVWYDATVEAKNNDGTTYRIRWTVDNKVSFYQAEEDLRLQSSRTNPTPKTATAQRQQTIPQQLLHVATQPTAQSNQVSSQLTRQAPRRHETTRRVDRNAGRDHTNSQSYNVAPFSESSNEPDTKWDIECQRCGKNCEEIPAGSHRYHSRRSSDGRYFYHYQYCSRRCANAAK